MIIITFGTYDLFHIGHLNLLKNCKKVCDGENTLIVGVSSDELNYKKKQKYPIIPLNDRMNIVKSLDIVDFVFIEHSLEDKLKYCIDHKADVLIMGSDHLGKFDYLKEHGINVLYTPRTENVSTTDIINKIVDEYSKI